MIKTVKKGKYKLIETKGQTKILTLDNSQTFAWVWAENIGELLVYSHNPHEIDHTLSVGEYYIYDVENEPGLTDLLHLELSVGNKNWQGYLLPTGIPEEKDSRKRIIPAKEIITNS